MEEVNRLWSAYEKYKETAEQHEFFKLLMIDSKVIPLYNDLKENYTEEHKNIFVRGMREILKSLGIKED